MSHAKVTLSKYIVKYGHRFCQCVVFLARQSIRSRSSSLSRSFTSSTLLSMSSSLSCPVSDTFILPFFLIWISGTEASGSTTPATSKALASACKDALLRRLTASCSSRTLSSRTLQQKYLRQMNQ